MRWQVGRFTAKGGSPATPEEIEELRDQGIVIMYELHKTWRPEDCALFSSYAISYFPRRLIDWYRKEITSSCRGHVPQVKGGKRLPIKYHGMVSLDTPVENGAVQTFSQDRALVHYDAVS